MRTIQLTIIVLGAYMTIWSACQGLPVLDLTNGDIDNTTLEELRASVNDSPKNLYIVKAVVYEIGILTEADDDDNFTSTETHERVDLTFFDAHTNESHIDFGNIPLPVQTNISGQVLTGIAPVNIGAFSNPSEILETLPLTGTIVNISHSNTAYFQLTKGDKKDHKSEILRSEDIAKIPQVAEIFPQVAAHPELIETPADLQNVV